MVILKNKEDKMSESKVYIIFHSADYDGMMSATIAKMHYYKDSDVNLVPYNYGQNIDLTPMVDSTVVMVDISLAETEMIFLKEHTEKFIWIDHHSTAIEKYKHLNIEGIQEVGKAACELTWEFFVPYLCMPKVVELLGRYDVWDMEYSLVNEARALQLALAYEGITVQNGFYDYLLCLLHDKLVDYSTVKLDKLIGIGTIISKYQIEQNKRTMDRLATTKDVVIGDKTYKAIVANTTGNSITFDGVYDPAIHDFMLRYCIGKNSEIQCSLYSTKENIHCGELASYFNGGGHKGAAGFTLDVSSFFNLLREI